MWKPALLRPIAFRPGRERLPTAVAAVAAVALLSGCASPTATLSVAGASPTSTAAALPSPAATVDHRIGVRVVGGAGEFFDRLTDERFAPRGANLIRLSGGRHSTLDPSQYDPDRVDATLAQMAADGYNVVRIFLNSYPGGLPGESAPLSPAYLDNAGDVLRRAKTHGLLVLYTADWLPESAAWSFASDPLIEDVNAIYLSAGGLHMNERFWGEFAGGLVERGAPLDALLAYELRNELYFTELYPPFSLGSGLVRTANGETYDLSSPDAHRQLLEDNLVLWVDRMRAAILKVDPTALVTVGFFQPKGPNTSRAGDDRLIETSEVIRRSTADFIDLHGYPGGDLNLRQIVENFDLPPVTDKPILLGEFGAEHGSYPSIDDAVRVLVEWQLESCTYGFDGWLLWTWDSVEQASFWNALDAEGALERALAPAVRPDPCSIGDLDLSFELARDATARASTALPDTPAGNAIDGLFDTIWNAEDDPPQWIEVDLGAERTVEQIRLLVAQDPAGPSTHVVTVRGTSGDARPVVTFAQVTADGDWLGVDLPSPLSGVRYVRVETTRLSLWPAWREISILGRRE